MSGPSDLTNLSDRDLGNVICDLAIEIAVCEARLDPPIAARRRTAKLIRSTFLTFGGALAATMEPHVAILVLVGFWERVETITDDARR